MTAPTSRYYGCEIATIDIDDGQGGAQAVQYLRRRFLPPVDETHILTGHVVRRGDRPDLIAAEHLGDAEQFWRVCDANPVLHPDELTADERVGTTAHIPLPVNLSTRGPVTGS